MTIIHLFQVNKKLYFLVKILKIKYLKKVENLLITNRL